MAEPQAPDYFVSVHPNDVPQSGSLPRDSADSFFIMAQSKRSDEDPALEPIVRIEPPSPAKSSSHGRYAFRSPPPLPPPPRASALADAIYPNRTHLYELTTPADSSPEVTTAVPSLLVTPAPAMDSMPASLLATPVRAFDSMPGTASLGEEPLLHLTPGHVSMPIPDSGVAATVSLEDELLLQTPPDVIWHAAPPSALAEALAYPAPPQTRGDEDSDDGTPSRRSSLLSPMDDTQPFASPRPMPLPTPIPTPRFEPEDTQDDDDESERRSDPHNARREHRRRSEPREDRDEARRHRHRQHSSASDARHKDAVRRIVREEARVAHLRQGLAQAQAQLAAESSRAGAGEASAVRTLEAIRAAVELRASAEREGRRAAEELAMHKAQHALAQQELARAQRVIDDAEQARVDARDDAARERARARRMRDRFSIQTAREEARKRGFQEGMAWGRREGYEDGRSKGWNEGVRATRAAVTRAMDSEGESQLQPDPATEEEEEEEEEDQDETETETERADDEEENISLAEDSQSYFSQGAPTSARSMEPPRSVGRSTEPPRSVRRGDEPPRSARRGDEPPRSARRGDEPPRSARRSDEPPRSARRSDEPERSARRSAEPPRSARRSAGPSHSSRQYTEPSNPRETHHGQGMFSPTGAIRPSEHMTAGGEMLAGAAYMPAAHAALDYAEGLPPPSLNGPPPRRSGPHAPREGSVTPPARRAVPPDNWVPTAGPDGRIRLPTPSEMRAPGEPGSAVHSTVGAAPPSHRPFSGTSFDESLASGMTGPSMASRANAPIRRRDVAAGAVVPPPVDAVPTRGPNRLSIIPEVGSSMEATPVPAPRPIPVPGSGIMEFVDLPDDDPVPFTPPPKSAPVKGARAVLGRLAKVVGGGLSRRNDPDPAVMQPLPASEGRWVDAHGRPVDPSMAPDEGGHRRHASNQSWYDQQGNPVDNGGHRRVASQATGSSVPDISVVAPSSENHGSAGHDRRSFAPSERSRRTSMHDPDARMARSHEQTGGGKLRRPRSRSPGPRAPSPNPSLRPTIVLDDPTEPMHPSYAYASSAPQRPLSASGRHTINLDDPPPSAISAYDPAPYEHQRPGPSVMQHPDNVARRMTSTSSIGSRRSFVSAASGYGRYDPDDDLDPAFLATPSRYQQELPTGPAPGSTSEARRQAARSEEDYGYSRRSSRWEGAERFPHNA